MNEKDEVRISSKQSALVEGILLLSSLTLSSIVGLLVVSKLLLTFPLPVAIAIGLLCFIAIVSVSYVLISILLGRSAWKA